MLSNYYTYYTYYALPWKKKLTVTRNKYLLHHSEINESGAIIIYLIFCLIHCFALPVFLLYLYS